MEQDEDLWADDSDYESKLREREWNLLKSTFSNNGYREGLEVGKEKTLQTGFNEGFKDGSNTGLFFGTFVGFITGMNTFLTNNPGACKDAQLRSEISSLTDSLTEISKARAKITTTQESEKTIEEAFNLIRLFIHSQLKRCSSLTKEDKQLLFTLIRTVLFSPLDKKFLHESFWDLFPLLINLLRDPDVQSQVEEILDEIGSTCNEKEIFMLVAEQFEQQKDIYVRKTLLRVLSKAMKRLQSGRARYLESLFPLLVSNIKVEVKESTQASASDFGVNVHTGLSEEAFNPDERYLQSLRLLIPVMIELCDSIASDLSKSRFNEKLDLEDSSAKEQHIVLSILLQLLGAMSYTPLQEADLAHAKMIVDLILKLNVSPFYLLRYESMLRNKKTDDIEDATDELPPQYVLSRLGIGCFLYLQLCSLEAIQMQMPSVLRPSQLLKLYIPYVIHMSENPKVFSKGFAIIRALIHNIPPESVSEENIADSPFLLLVESMITFMVKCPVDKIRTEALQLMQEFISVLDKNSKFELLRASVLACPYPSATAVLLHRVKQEVEKDWPKSAEEPPSSPFVSPKLLELISSVRITTEVAEKKEVVMATLSLIRFLLIRDKTTNYVGLWEKTQLSELRRDYLQPLLKEIKQQIEAVSTPITQQDEELRRRVESEYGLPQLSKEDHERVNLQTLTFLQLLEDTVRRVLELVKGAEPLSGKPSPEELTRVAMNTS